MPTDWDESAEAWIKTVQTDVGRRYLIDPVLLDRLGDLVGKRVCDVGGGEGRFARLLAERGAHVVAIDPTIRLLEQGEALGGGPIYLRAVSESLPFPTSSFDRAVSYISLIDIPDYRTAIREMARILKPGGELLIANLNAFVTPSPKAWVEDQNGNKLFVAVDHYFGERANEVAWNGIRVINWHRPQYAYFSALLDAGLRLTFYAEPQPSAEDLQREPRLQGSDRVPYFHVMAWEKPR